MQDNADRDPGTKERKRGLPGVTSQPKDKAGDTRERQANPRAEIAGVDEDGETGA